MVKMEKKRKNMKDSSIKLTTVFSTLQTTLNKNPPNDDNISNTTTIYGKD